MSSLPPLEVDDEAMGTAWVSGPDLGYTVMLSMAADIVGLVADEHLTAVWGAEEYRRSGESRHRVHHPGVFDVTLPPALERRLLDAVRASITPELVAEIHAHLEERFNAALTVLHAALVSA